MSMDALRRPDRLDMVLGVTDLVTMPVSAAAKGVRRAMGRPET